MRVSNPRVRACLNLRVPVKVSKPQRLAHHSRFRFRDWLYAGWVLDSQDTRAVALSPFAPPVWAPQAAQTARCVLSKSAGPVRPCGPAGNLRRTACGAQDMVHSVTSHAVNFGPSSISSATIIHSQVQRTAAVYHSGCYHSWSAPCADVQSRDPRKPPNSDHYTNTSSLRTAHHLLVSSTCTCWVT